MSAEEIDFLREAEPAQVEAETPQPDVTEEATGDTAPPPGAAQPVHSTVPIQVMLDEREKRQAAQREAEEARKRVAEYERQLAELRQPRTPPVDLLKDPETRLAMERQQVQQVMLNERLNTSEMMAAQAHGQDVVEAAKVAFLEAARQNPALHAEAMRQIHPYDYVVKWHRQQSLLSEIGSDPAAYKERLRAELMAELQAQMAPARPQIPGSLAAAPAAGKTVTQRPRSGFPELFG